MERSDGAPICMECRDRDQEKGNREEEIREKESIKKLHKKETETRRCISIWNRYCMHIMMTTQKNFTEWLIEYY